MKIKSITRRKFKGVVYNIGTTPNHNYFANNVLVHNCYQGSTINGKHASIDHIRQIINELANNEVFEIAFGGGEPTSHPDFVEILKMTRDSHIIPNFTTKDLKWVKRNMESILPYFGSFAYSVSHSKDVYELSVVRDFYGVQHHKIAAQYVMGSSSRYALESIVEACSNYNVPLTLLGFKEQHRGATYKKQDYSNWLDIIKDLREKKNLYCKIGIDTAMATQFVDLLKDNFPNWLYHSEEGNFSCYIDAVDKKMGPSSYHALESYNNIYQEFNEKYSRY